MNIFKPKKIDLTQGGLAKVLGTLEADIVEYIWDHAPSTAREVCDSLNKNRDISFNAVNTVINRLVEKNILTRAKRHGFWEYTARASREQMYKLVAENILSSLMRDKQLFSPAAFLQAIDSLPDDQKKILRQHLH